MPPWQGPVIPTRQASSMCKLSVHAIMGHAERYMAAEQDWLARLRKAPAIVRAHYQRMLLEWTAGALARFSSAPAADDSRATKKRRLNAGTVYPPLSLVVLPETAQM